MGGAIPKEKRGEIGSLDQYLAQYDEWNGEYHDYIRILETIETDDGELLSYLSGMVSHYSALKDNYLNSVIAVVCNDTAFQMPQNNLFETLRYLFEYRGQYIDYLSIAETWLAEGNYRAALATLSKMYKQFDLDEEQIDEVTAFQTYVDWLQRLANMEMSIYALPDREVIFLVDYAYTQIGRGVVFAKNILCALYDICLDDTPIEKSGIRDTVSGDDERIENLTLLRSYALTVSNNALENIKLVPNPTTGELQVTSYELPVTSVEIYDVYGKSHVSNLISQDSNPKINISHLPAGVYFVKITTQAGEVVKKVVKQ
jgi:hypothetical protein